VKVGPLHAGPKGSQNHVKTTRTEESARLGYVDLT
jgi:hypothetical protein